MLLLSLLARKMKGIEPIVDYNKSHVVTSNQYLEILQRKVTKRKQKNKKNKEIRKGGTKSLVNN